MIRSYLSSGPDMSDPFIQVSIIAGKNTETNKYMAFRLSEEYIAEDVLLAWTKICVALEQLSEICAGRSCRHPKESHADGIGFCSGFLGNNGTISIGCFCGEFRKTVGGA